MKKNMLLSVAASLLLFVSLSSCKKSSDESQSRAAMIVGTWNLNAYGVDDNGNGLLETGEYDPVPAGAFLQQTYRSDGTGVFTTQAPGSSPTYTNITWSLTDNEQNLRVVAGAATTNATISEFTANRLQGYDPAQSPRYVYILTK